MADFIRRDPGRNVWACRLDIPERVRHAFLDKHGQPKKVLVKSLLTTDKQVAKQRAALVVAAWRRQFSKAGAGVDPRRQEAERWRSWLTTVDTGEPDDQTATLLTDRAQEIEKTHGTAAAQLFARTADGRAVMIETMADRWLQWKSYPARSEYQHRRHLALLLKAHQEVTEVNRKAASAFVTSVLLPGRDASTITRIVSSYHGLWSWMRREEIVEGDNPWREQGPSSRAEVKGVRSSKVDGPRRAYTEAEAQLFLGSLAPGVDLDVSMLLAVTGMRAEEACSLLPGDVSVDAGGVTWAKVTRGKTSAAKRRVPVVDLTVAAMLNTRATAGAAAVFSELPVDKFGDRTRQIVNRLRRRLRAVMGTDDPTLTALHGWRHRARTLLEQAAIVPSTCDFLLGHVRPGEGLSRYSRPSDEQLIAAVRAMPLPAAPKIEAIEKLAYPSL